MDLREETVKLLGKADMYFFSPEHPPLTEPTNAALEWAIKAHGEKGEWASRHTGRRVSGGEG